MVQLTSYTELFKAQVAARIGREPHQIMLKRQGERPFKDALTLEDYGVSNGVQLDLYVWAFSFLSFLLLFFVGSMTDVVGYREVDTGD